MDEAETLQWSRAFFSEISVGLNLGSNVYITAFALASSVELGALTRSC